MVSPVDSRAMETKDILASIEETKDLIRRVRTPGGARRYGQPIGSIIVPDAPIPGARRKRSKRTASTPTSPRSAEPTKGRQGGAQEHPLASKPAEPLDFQFNRNPQSSTAHVKDPKAYGRDVEPAGRYMTQRSGDFTPDGWESGTVRFERPLYLDATQDDYGAEDHWKRRLSAHYGGKKGKALSQALRNDGYDAIVTHDKYGIGETIDLTGFKPKEGRRGAERVPVLAAQVAPSPEVAEGSDEVVEVGAKPFNDGGKGQLYTEGVKYVKNDPLITSAMDFDFMRNGTAEEAHKRLVAMGAKVSVGRNFAKNREFMTALAEVNRILEDEFPGFVARHGVYHSMGVKGKAAAFNAMIHRDSTSEDFQETGGKAIADAYNIDNVFGGAGQRQIESSELNGTATVFTSGTINGGAQVDAGMRRTSRNPVQSHMSATDIVDTFEKEGLSKDQLWMTHIMVHELGHAISMAVAGRMSFEIDGKEDPDQEQRRWYREYYANSRLKFLDEMGVIKWTGKEYVADSLIDQKEYVKAQAELNIPNPPKRPKTPPRNASEKARENYGKRMVEYQIAYDEWREERMRIITRQKELANQGKTPSFTPNSEAGDGAMGYSAASSNLHVFFQAHAKAGFLEEIPGNTGVHKYYNYEPIKNMTSDYGSTQWMETEAETWAAYMLNGTVTEGVSKWGEQMHTMYQWWTDDDAEMGKNR